MRAMVCKSTATYVLPPGIPTQRMSWPSSERDVIRSARAPAAVLCLPATPEMQTLERTNSAPFAPAFWAATSQTLSTLPLFLFSDECFGKAPLCPFFIDFGMDFDLLFDAFR